MIISQASLVSFPAHYARNSYEASFACVFFKPIFLRLNCVKVMWQDIDCDKCKKHIQTYNPYFVCPFCKIRFCYDCTFKHKCTKMPEGSDMKMDKYSIEFINCTFDTGYKLFYYAPFTSIRFTNCKVLNSCEKMFAHSYVEQIYLDGLDTSDVTNMRHMFGQCGYIKEIDINHLNTSNVTTMRGMFKYYGTRADGAHKITLDKIDTSKVTDMSKMFSGLRCLHHLDVSNFNTSNVVNMYSMFNNCYVHELDLSRWDVSNVTNMNGMFSCTEELDEINLGNWNVSNVISMKYMFNGTNLNQLELNWNCQNVISMKEMFTESKLINVKLHLNCPNVSSMEYMFYKCEYLRNADIEFELQKPPFHGGEGSFRTQLKQSSDVCMSMMFYGCKQLESVKLRFGGSKLSNLSKMFYECVNLKLLDITGLILSHNTDIDQMFYKCRPKELSFEGITIRKFDMLEYSFPDIDDFIDYDKLEEDEEETSE